MIYFWRGTGSTPRASTIDPRETYTVRLFQVDSVHQFISEIYLLAEKVVSSPPLSVSLEYVLSTKNFLDIINLRYGVQQVQKQLILALVLFRLRFVFPE